MTTRIFCTVPQTRQRNSSRRPNQLCPRTASKWLVPCFPSVIPFLFDQLWYAYFQIEFPLNYTQISTKQAVSITSLSSAWVLSIYSLQIELKINVILHDLQSICNSQISKFDNRYLTFELCKMRVKSNLKPIIFYAFLSDVKITKNKVDRIVGFH